MKILTRQQIAEILPTLDLIKEIEKGFLAYSEGKAVVPPIGEMILEKGEVHIKYGYLKNGDNYVIKIASGFYDEPGSNQMVSNGMMLLFSQHSGQPLCALLDKGLLTHIRTAIAGAIVAKYLAPGKVHKIGIVGAGTQARLQLSYLKKVVDCQEVLVWGIGREECQSYKTQMEKEGFVVKITDDVENIQEQCNLIVTTTPSNTPLLDVMHLKKGTHITAVGSDTPEKQELAPGILKRADLVVADSIEQCKKRGEIYKALGTGFIEKNKLVELGQIIAGEVAGRKSEEQITVADLTGVAVQDLAIASAVYRASLSLYPDS
jgi:ornithine cyclodeaminase